MLSDWLVQGVWDKDDDAVTLSDFDVSVKSNRS